ncbi:hypothetical protein DRJ22_03530 [Candidatus Woesearchaeota archaeon]|nr:MAG: hypothetical protein B6U93_01225 [Candidatus Woesearchaeota archaeon ex4484_78]RLE45801.1 MAG: hypothetical protein DRJ22_03530 [Candidatus Woesearchaeota archaeon]
MLIRKKTLIIRLRRPPRHRLNEELQWFGRSLGLFGERDKDKTCFRIFIELLKAARHQKPLSSDELAEKLNLSRGTIVHHINSLIEKGIIVPEKRRYALRAGSLKELIESIQSDFEATLKQLKTIAEELDEELW